jgi:hypothetical protein
MKFWAFTVIVPCLLGPTSASAIKRESVEPISPNSYDFVSLTDWFCSRQSTLYLATD